MQPARITEKVALHRSFRQRKAQSHPIAAFRVAEDFFFSRHFKAAAALPVPGKRITPEMLNVDLFLDDYERMFRLSEEIDQDAFWTAEPRRMKVPKPPRLNNAIVH